MDRIYAPSVYERVAKAMREEQDFDEDGRLLGSSDEDRLTRPGVPINPDDLFFPLPEGLELREDDHLLYVYRGDELLGCFPTTLSRDVAERVIRELAERFGR